MKKRNEALTFPKHNSQEQLESTFFFHCINLLISGGGVEGGFNSTLIYRGGDTDSFQSGPFLPVGVEDSCAVKLSDTTFAILGGIDDDGSSRVRMNVIKCKNWANYEEMYEYTLKNLNGERNVNQLVA